MENIFGKDWSDYNNGYPLDDSDVARYISVTPSENQRRHQSKPFYCFIHFGMNTATAREWGTARETVKDFTIKSINARQWVSAIKNSGATGIILTCKHHDGFCLWQTKTTEHSIKNSPYKNGRGDVVKEVSDVCKKYGLKFGVYLSPWDRNAKCYGTPAYNHFYIEQLT